MITFYGLDAREGFEFAVLRMAASHGLIAGGDLSEVGFAWRELEFAVLRMAASHGLIAGGDLSEVGFA